MGVYPERDGLAMTAPGFVEFPDSPFHTLSSRTLPLATSRERSTD